MNNFDIYNLLTPEEKEVVNQTVAEAISREFNVEHDNGIDLNSFDYELIGVRVWLMKKWLN
mgnify:CR=1 FL=1